MQIPELHGNIPFRRGKENLHLKNDQLSAIIASAHADVVQWQNTSFPSL